MCLWTSGNVRWRTILAHLLVTMATTTRTSQPTFTLVTKYAICCSRSLKTLDAAPSSLANQLKGSDRFIPDVSAAYVTSLTCCRTALTSNNCVPSHITSDDLRFLSPSNRVRKPLNTGFQDISGMCLKFCSAVAAFKNAGIIIIIIIIIFRYPR